VFLPFFAFEANLTATFTGELGYTRTHTSYHNGKSRTRRSTDWYSRSDMSVGPHLINPSVSSQMLQYAGFDYRREFVHLALGSAERDASLIGSSLARQLDTARPLHAGMLPDGVGVHEFEAKPSFAYAAATASSLDKVAHTMAMQRLQDPKLDLQFSSAFGFSHACPATDWTAPNRYNVSSLQRTVSGARLHPNAGVVLAPFWICDYTLNGKDFRAFLNAADGAAAGATHVDQGKAQLAMAACGGCLSLVTAFFVNIECGNEMAALVAAAGPVVGYLLGGWRHQQTVSFWDDAGEKRAVLRKQNEEWAKDPYWQAELRKYASTWESKEDQRRANAIPTIGGDDNEVKRKLYEDRDAGLTDLQQAGVYC
jgi:hypothetical protein